MPRVNITGRVFDVFSSDIKRLYSKVEKVNECWIWTGALQTGYGAIRVDRRVVGAHQLSYAINKGDIPKGSLICHSCDNPKCINPDHLSIGNHSTNAKEHWERQRWPAMGK